MKIAFVSYEYPPCTAFGGIATYVQQAAVALTSIGYQVEVFCGTTANVSSFHQITEQGIRVHRTACTQATLFKQAVLPIFIERHNAVQFDVVESPEYNADGYEIKKRFPTLPMVVKLHTPTYMVGWMNKSWKQKQILQRLKKIFNINPYLKQKDIEYQFCLMADKLCTPSVDLANKIAKQWCLKRSTIATVPNIYKPAQALLNIPLHSTHQVVSFIGRVEIRKGVLTLAQAIPIVLQQHKNVVFNIVGKCDTLPRHKGTVADIMKRHLNNFAASVQFKAAVTLQEIPTVLANTDICVFPSIWENFPNVCLEAMSAGRGIVASTAGGMKDMLEDINGGMLVAPENPVALANAIIYLLNHPEERMQMAQRARTKVINYYGHQLLQEVNSFYKNAMLKN
jgi:glycogen synthase